MGIFMRALNFEKGIAARALEFAILTAARSGEVRFATWSEIDYKTCTWTIPAERMKGGREHRVPLSDAAMAVLGSLVMLVGVVLMFIPNPPELPFPLPMAMLVVSAFTALMVVFKFLDHHSDTAIGIWVSLIGALVAAYGAYEMGGRFSTSTSSG
jgi:hypothetical protein